MMRAESIERVLRRMEKRLEARFDALEQRVQAVAMPPRLLGYKSAAKLLGRGLETLKADVEAGRVRTKMRGRARLIPMDEIVRLTARASPSRGAPEPVPYQLDRPADVIVLAQISIHTKR